jgi:hypothetical protein
MGVAIAAPGGNPHWQSKVAARKQPVRMAYHEGRMARLCPLRGPVGIDRNQRAADLTLAVFETERRCPSDGLRPTAGTK